MTVSKQKKQLIRELLINGCTYSEICLKAGCSKSTISSVKAEFSMPVRCSTSQLINSTEIVLKNSTKVGDIVAVELDVIYNSRFLSWMASVVKIKGYCDMDKEQLKQAIVGFILDV